MSESKKLLKEYIRYMLESREANCGFFQVGDEILYGKWKNKKGKIVGISYDERENPIVEIEPIPKGRKANVTIGLYRIWPAGRFQE